MTELRYYQAESTPAILKYLKRNKKKNPLVALPTGAGKTYCIADLIKHVRENWGINVLVLSHVKEIIEQNHAAISSYTGYDVGINSAMLGRREIKPVTVAGIQSIYRYPEAFRHFKLIIIDEAHMVSITNNTMYQKFLEGVGNPTTVGFTATPFRMNTGYIYGPEGDTLFDSLVLNWSTKGKFTRLVDDGFLSKIITKRTDLEMDTTGIKMVAGDFNEADLADRFNRDAITLNAIKEILAAGAQRNKWLIFAIDIAHANRIAEILNMQGIPTAPVHSKMDEFGFDRDSTIEGFKNGKYKCVTNVNILTTGFDNPSIDLIAMLRPTTSPVLHVQSLGRGSRVCDGKRDCLVLDFAGNTARLGPINDPFIKVKGKGIGGEPITKTCPDCQTIHAPALKMCDVCGYEFKFDHGLQEEAFDDSIIEKEGHQWLKVNKTSYGLHSNFGSPTSVKVTYHCGRKEVNEFVCIEHKGFAQHKAKHWIKFRGGEECESANQLMEQVSSLRMPSSILVKKQGKYLNVQDSAFAG